MLSKINPRLKKTLLVVVGIPLLYLGTRSCFTTNNPSISNIEKRISKIEKTIEKKQYGFAVEEVLRGLENNPEYVNTLFEASFNAAAITNSYGDKTRASMFNFARNQMEKNPELTEYLGPNALQYIKRKAINKSASKIINNVHDGIKEGYKIIKGK